MRPLLGLLHRWAGLVLAVFLVFSGITGSAIVWMDELDRLAWPALRDLPARPGAPLDALALRAAVMRDHPGYTIDALELAVPASPRRPVRLDLAPSSSSSPALGAETWFDPYTGREVGRRHWGDISEGAKNLAPFLYRLHSSLALGDFGTYVLGIVALIWTIDCFVGAYLTVPRGRPFFQKWRPAWGVQRKRLSFDLHRAGGLWAWAMLFVLAWSSVGFNLRQVYAPTMKALFAYHEAWDDMPDLPAPGVRAGIDFEQALRLGRIYAAQESKRLGFRVESETRLMYIASKGAYLYAVGSDRDIRRQGGGTMIWFDGRTGRLLQTSLPRGQYAGNTLTEWFGELHTAGLWGWPYRLFMTAMGGVVAMLSATGAVIWWRKRRARRANRDRVERAHPAASRA